MWIQVVPVLAVLTLGVPSIGTAQSSHSSSDTWQWAGELVSIDATALTMTVKSRVVYQDAISELKQFKPGERLLIVWSGVHDYSDGVRQVRRAQPGSETRDTFVLPAELVSTEAPNQYVTIRVKVPESAIANLKAVKPGEWVMVTSRHRPSTDAGAVTAVKPYVAKTN
jgi:hypothetical protein